VDIKAYIESGVIESYVLGMAESQEAAELEQLSHQYPEIKQAIDAFEAAMEKQSLAAGIQPPSGVKDALFASLSDEFKKDTSEGRLVSINWSRYAIAASVVLLIASAALNIYFYNQFRSTATAYQNLLAEKNTLIAENQNTQTKVLDLYNSMQMMSDPTVIKVSMQGIAGKENSLATVFWDSKSKDVYLLPNKLPEAGADKQYQLWAIVDGKPVDAGVMDVCAGLCKMKNIPNASMFAITLEKKGGSPTPTMSEMYVAGKVG
jgi:anti-sigma-K factor RskA